MESPRKRPSDLIAVEKRHRGEHSGNAVRKSREAGAVERQREGGAGGLRLEQAGTFGPLEPRI